MTRKGKDNPTAQIWRRLKKNKLAVTGLFVLAGVFLIALLAPWIAPYGYAKQNLSIALRPPNMTNLFGTDNFGRDLFSRVLYGTRYTLLIGFCCGTIAMLIGGAVGVLAGVNKKLDILIMRGIDIIMGIPSFTLALCLVVAMGQSLFSIMVALSITTIPDFARMVRVEVFKVCEQEYVEAAISVGSSKLRIIREHILPNCFPLVIIQYSYQVVQIIMTGAALSFIGMGIQAPEPEWGLMISQGRAYLRDSWHMAIIPGVALMIVTYALNLLGDGLRDAVDPRLKQ